VSPLDLPVDGIPISRLSAGQEDTMELVVNGMRCGHCEAAVQRAVRRVSPQAEVVIARADGRVSITGATDPTAVEDAIRQEGYQVSSAG
jgi:copper chaperone